MFVSRILPRLSAPAAAARRFYAVTPAAGSPASEKFYGILEDYRREHYRQTIPSRFVKEVLKHTDTNRDGLMDRSEFEAFLENIGASHRLTKEDVREIMSHVGAKNDEVSIAKLQELLVAELTTTSS